MFYFGRWTVQEEPAFGRATMTLWVGADGRALGPPHHDSASLYAGMEERSITFSISSEPWHRTGVRPFACDALVDRIEPSADPSHPESYAEAIIAIAGDVQLDRSEYDEKITPYFVRGARPKRFLRLRVIRVMDASLLPDLGEPIDVSSLLPMEKWTVLDGIIDDWTLEREAGDAPLAMPSFTLVSADDEWQLTALPDGFFPAFMEFRNLIGDVLFDEVWIRRLEYGIEFGCPRESTMGDQMESPRGFKWLVSVKWRADERALVHWRWDSPYRYRNAEDLPQARLRLVLSPSIEQDFEYRMFQSGPVVDKHGNALDDLTQPEKCIDYDPVRVEVQIADVLDRHAADLLATDELGPVRPPQRIFDHWPDQLAHSLRGLVLRDPALAFQTPVLLIAPVAPEVALLLGAALAAGSVYSMMAERAHIARKGYDSTWQPRSLSDAEADLNWAIAGLLLSLVGPAFKGAAALRYAMQVSVRPEAFAAAMVRVSTPMRLLFDLANKKKLAALIPRATRTILVPDEVLLAGQRSAAEMAALTEAFQQNLIRALPAARALPGRVAPTYLLTEMAMDSIFRPDGSGFKLAFFQSLYKAYVRGIQENFELAGSAIDLARAQGRLVNDPATWLLRGGPSARKSKAMARLLGPGWRAMVRDYRDTLPLSAEVLEIYNAFPGELTYQRAQSLRNSLVPDNLKRIALNPLTVHHPRYPELWERVRTANKKAFGVMFHLEHPFERRCVKVFGGPKDPDGLAVLNYETEAKVILVPAIWRVARHIPGFSGYVHWDKSRMLEALIAYGHEAEYSLQEMRDAHVFVLAASRDRTPAQSGWLTRQRLSLRGKRRARSSSCL